MVLVFSISDTVVCQMFKLFFKKRRGAGKTTNLPPAIIHMITRDNIPSDHKLPPSVQSCKGKMTLLGLGF